MVLGSWRLACAKSRYAVRKKKADDLFVPFNYLLNWKKRAQTTKKKEGRNLIFAWIVTQTQFSLLVSTYLSKYPTERRSIKKRSGLSRAADQWRRDGDRARTWMHWVACLLPQSASSLTQKTHGRTMRIASEKWAVSAHYQALKYHESWLLWSWSSCTYCLSWYFSCTDTRFAGDEQVKR